MQINVAQLLKSPIGSERNYDIDEKIDVYGKELAFKGKVKLTRTDRNILVVCSLTTEMEVECSRCLEPYKCPLKIHFEEEFFPTIDVISGLPSDMPEKEPGSFTIDQNHILDLDTAIRQYTLLTVPMKPLCDENCAGICPTCGKNLNTGCCRCQAEEIDPRLAQLNNFLKAKYSN
jgi:uncharacterized protein